MTNPITPPPELVQQWLGTYFGTTVTGEVSGVELALATQAARWGADQELEACCKWVDWKWSGVKSRELRAARRTKPPSLKARALVVLTQYMTGETILTKDSVDTIRRALEQL